MVADADDPASLAAMAARAKVIITTVGPYQLYGEGLVAACAEAGTDYVDLTGESHWIAQMIAAHEAKAKASGARLVFSCGFDSIPFDLGVFFVEQAGEGALRRAGARACAGGCAASTAAFPAAPWPAAWRPWRPPRRTPASPACWPTRSP